MALVGMGRAGGWGPGSRIGRILVAQGFYTKSALVLFPPSPPLELSIWKIPHIAPAESGTSPRSPSDTHRNMGIMVPHRVVEKCKVTHSINKHLPKAYMPGTLFSNQGIYKPFSPGTRYPVTCMRVNKQMTCIVTRAVTGVQNTASPVPGSVAA